MSNNAIQLFINAAFACDDEWLGEDMLFYMSSRIRQNITRLEELEGEIDELLIEDEGE